ncbi:MAG: hypothetical protein LBG15_04555 [Dysgonamonadaceae bacterium]|nr:hypothetical protein [Dysgonamonadaceae bacterium]
MAIRLLVNLLRIHKTGIHVANVQIFDHLPLWVELKIDFSNQYLEKIKTALFFS